jgi:hypothetical protein
MFVAADLQKVFRIIHVDVFIIQRDVILHSKKYPKQICKHFPDLSQYVISGPYSKRP